jgi:hypothetical protein
VDPEQLHEDVQEIREKGIPVSRKLKRERISKAKMQEANELKELGLDDEREDLSGYSYVTVEDLDVSDLLDEIVEYRYPDFRQVIRDNFEWTTKHFPDKYLTDKKVGFRRLSSYDQNKLNQTIARVNRTKGGFRNITQGDMNELAIALEKCFVLDPDNDEEKLPAKEFMKMPSLQLMWFSRTATLAQGFTAEMGDNLK